jgi:hypothetical protein
MPVPQQRVDSEEDDESMSGDEHEEQELLMRKRGSKFGRTVLIAWLSTWLAIGLVSGLLMLVQSHRTTPNKLSPVRPAGTQLSHAHDDSGLHGVRKASTIGRHSSPPPPPLPPRREEDSITLDGTMEAALRLVSARYLRRQGMHRLALLTFGNAGVKEHLLNFCAFAAKARAPHVVGAVDEAMMRLLSAQRTPVYETPLVRVRYTLDGANSHSSASWKRFAAMRTGEVAKMLHLGWDVLHTDTDVVWLRDPSPYLLCTPRARRGDFGPNSPFPCEAFSSVDVAASSDNMGPSRALKGGAAYAAGGTLNSGILFFRSTAVGVRFADE